MFLYIFIFCYNLQDPTEKHLGGVGTLNKYYHYYYDHYDCYFYYYFECIGHF